MTDTTIQPVCSRGDYRVIRRNGAVVAFEPHKLSTAMTKAFMAVAGPIIKKVLERARSNTSKATDGAGSVSSTGISGEGGGGAGGGGDDGDGDGNGDGDGDGPRRKRSLRRKSHPNSALRRESSSPPQPSTDRSHGHALLAFTIVTALLLGTILAFGLNGQPALAEKVLGAFVSVATVAAAFLRPK